LLVCVLRRNCFDDSTKKKKYWLVFLLRLCVRVRLFAQFVFVRVRMFTFVASVCVRAIVVFVCLIVSVGAH
jgi:hypothetical protein